MRGPLTSPGALLNTNISTKRRNIRVISVERGFTFVSQLAAHLPSHGAKLHRCAKPNCNKSFTHAGDLKKHQKTHSKKWWRCTVAGCTYKNRDERNLKSHKISHTNTKGFSCRYCDESFRWSMQLVRHYRDNKCVKVKRSDSPTF